MIPGVLGQLSAAEEEVPTDGGGGTVFWNSADKHADITLSNGDLTATSSASATARAVRSTASHTTGQHYFEGRLDAVGAGDFAAFGIALAGMGLTQHLGAQGGSAYSAGLHTDGHVWSGPNVDTDVSKPLSVAEWCGIAVDLDAGKMWVRDSAGWVGDPEAGTGNTVSFSLGGAAVFAAFQGFNTGDEGTGNFGFTTFQYTIPAGFTSWDGTQEGAESGALSGTATLMFTPAADLEITGSGELSGTTGLTFTPAADLTIGGTFVPTDLGASLKAWFDFSDTGTITDAGSGAVSQVTDKSGNSQTITQGTGTARPTTGTNTLNGFNVLTFDGGDDLARLASVSLPSRSSGVTLLCLKLHTSGTSGGLVWQTQQSGSFGDNASMGRDAGNMGAWGNGTTGGTTGSADYADSDNTNWRMISATYTEAARILYEDGTLKDTDSTALTSAGTVTGLVVGRTLSHDRSTNRFITGRIAQVLILDGVDATNRQKIEGWAMWKYGLEANLPGGHPYENAPP